ncbi:MAG: SAM-dependent chlorinase/fluorinase [Candidatus Eiseniibacteriota bacterium]|nr:MAG: SAM-dependent chlorinase/fluorinase [Candidatus Eisenbacteria bacterium]
MRSVIAIMTDFGAGDWYVGTMKGIIAGINPDVLLVDVTHDITPCSVLEAAFALKSCHRFFPQGTVFLVVVDPGVGTERRPLAVEAGGRFFVGPDNGVFGLVLQDEPPTACVEIRQDPPPESSTFHGRDIFAPAAARLSLGRKLNELGTEAEEPVKLSLPEPKRIFQDEFQGEVIYVDRFGNLVTNIPAQLATPSGGRPRVKVLTFTQRGVSISRACLSYAELGRGEPGILMGSAGYLEVALFGASAAKALGVESGEPFTLTLGEAVEESAGP